jgi:hypothetical protein
MAVYEGTGFYFSSRNRGGYKMKKIAIIENGFIRDSQIYTGDPADIDVAPNWEWNFKDLKNPCQYVGIFEGATDEEIIRQAAEYEGVHPDVITLITI